MDSGGSTSDYARGYRIDVSPDGSAWTTAATGAGAAALVTATFGSRTARYLRITQTGSASSWWSIAELNLYP
jgi:beta-glucosidase